ADPGESRSALGVWPTGAVAEAFGSLPADAKSRMRLVPGHFLFGIHRALGRPGRYITLLRHPVDRVVSSYYYILSQPGIPVREKLLAQNMSLADYVNSGLGLDPHNYQTRILAGLPEYDANWDETAGRIEVPRAALDLAIRNVDEHFLLAGVSERFNEFVLVLKLLLGWPLERLLHTALNRT